MRIKALSSPKPQLALDGRLRRRDVLALGSAAAVAWWIDGLAGVSPASAEDLAGGRPLSVGYVRGSDRWPDLRVLPWSTFAIPDGEEPVEVVPLRDAAASAVQSINLADRAMVSVRGLYPAVPAAGETAIRTINLDILYPAPDGGAGPRLPFFAWSFAQRTVSSVSPPVRFVIPVDDRGLLVAVTVDPADLPAARGKAPRSRLTQLSRAARLTGSLGGLGLGGPLLARGVYLLGLGIGAWDRGGVLQPRLDALDPALLSIVVTVDPLSSEAES
jgi:hypothetical protein